MFESDSGVFKPTGFGFRGPTGTKTIQEIATLLKGIGADTISAVGGGADIGPSVQAAGIPALSLDVDGNYFLVHHTEADTVDKIDPHDMSTAAAAIAVMAYVARIWHNGSDKSGLGAGVRGSGGAGGNQRQQAQIRASCL